MTQGRAEAPRVAPRRALARLAGDRNGVFTASAARALGVTSSSLAYYSRTGAIERLGHGVYRLADFPSSPQEPLIAAAAALGKDAVVSHESALKLYGVSDVAPSRLHFTVPRARRYLTVPANVELHTTKRPFAPGDVVQHEGFRATSLARSIVDAARAYTGPEQIVMAVREGLRRGLLTSRQLERATQNAPKRIRDLVEEGQGS
jgi:predicted transcriptional regulator of viral defense system